MSTYADRLASFTDWPLVSPTPQDLARAGLSHKPMSDILDNVICKTCDHCICDWEPDDDPDIELYITYLRCSDLWIPTSQKKPSANDIGFFDPSLQYDFPELCLFQDVHVFCDRVKRCRFSEADILELLPIYLPASSPSPPSTPRILSPLPAYRAISPSPPSYLTVADLSARYARPPCLKVDDLFRMFGGPSATKSSITITIDDPFASPFVFKESIGSARWESRIATSYYQIARAHCSAPRSVCERCR